MAVKKKHVKRAAVDKVKAEAKKGQAKAKPAAAGRSKTRSSSKKALATEQDATGEAAEPRRAAPNKAGSRVDPPPSDSESRQTYLTKQELQDFEKLLLNLRDQVVDEISSLTADNLSGKTFGRTGEEGTDNFNREFALKLVSSEQDIIYEIDEALRRIATGTYGMCEFSGEPIEKERLKVMPHARHCVRVQSELERGRIRYRPFAPPSIRSD